MSKLIVTEFITLDGVVEAPGGESSHPHTAWVFDYFSPDMEAWKLAEVLEAESQLLGRVTYEGFAEAWPSRGGPFADKMNGMPKYVVSKTLSGPLAWNNTQVLRGDLVEEVQQLKARSNGPILVAGSATLVRSLLDNDLVDELRLMVFPVMIGGGKRCFPESRNKLALQLVDTKTFRKGPFVQTYVRA
jgi:dihydrofolate reductase